MTDSEFQRAISKRGLSAYRVILITIFAVITLMLGAWDIVH